jgi:DHA3 family macrolide efflux protein-like MFS transporter
MNNNIQTPAHENKKFSHFIIVWFGQLLSSIGSGLTAFALGIYVFQLTGSATKYSLILLATFLPSLLLKPIGGTLSDRINRKTLMMIGDLGCAAGVMFIVIMMEFGIREMWVIYLGSIISSIFYAFQNPAYKASVTDLVSKELYTKASGLMQLAESSRYLIAPIIAAFLIKIIDIKYVLIMDALTYIVAIITVFWITTLPSASLAKKSNQHFIADLIDGFHYLIKQKSIFLLICIVSFITFFIGLFQALLGPMILSFETPQAFGISQSLSTTGMLIGSFFIGVFGTSTKKIPLLSFSILIAGIFFSLIGISENIIYITIFGFLYFLVLPFINTSLDVLVRKNVANEMQGRLWAIISLISQLGMAIAFGIAGYLADSIFNPLLASNGTLASTVGAIIGSGPGRGIGLIFILSGLFVSITAIIISQIKMLKSLDEHDAINT